ncbi:hypothetical protein [Corynebacterium casei]|uniref:hypothetical protein n=1 Tax=Corynebacterium casei TaxID=160386 RepID=UPI002649AC8D|nr:hypothetical protein [Corynebacterium casei]MDN6263971.1 hypothetical protein [Corynebacterium casei]
MPGSVPRTRFEHSAGFQITELAAVLIDSSLSNSGGIFALNIELLTRYRWIIW